MSKSKVQKPTAKVENSDRCVPLRFTRTQHKEILEYAKGLGIGVTAALRDIVARSLELTPSEVKQGRRA